jgi:hypothetical protein
MYPDCQEQNSRGPAFDWRRHRVFVDYRSYAAALSSPKSAAEDRGEMVMRSAFAAAAVICLILSPAYAQSQDWQEYRPDQGGFRIEMPGKPDLKTEERNGRPTYSAVVGIDKSVAGDDLVFMVKYQEGDNEPGPAAEKILDTVVKAMSEGGKLLDVKNESLGGYPARRFSLEDADKDTYEIRGVITDHYFIQALFIGPAGNAQGKRFLDSFAIIKP